MATITFLWHLHQPAYRTADGTAHAPWVAMHAGGAYTTLARAILETGGRGQVVNIVPTLLEQLLAYAAGSVHDPVLEALIRPATRLGESGRRTVVDWAFHTPSRQLDRYPRLRELASRRSTLRTSERLAAFFGPGDLRDLQVLFTLAQAGDQAWRDERLRQVSDRSSHFTADDQAVTAHWLQDQAGELLQLWQRLAQQDGVEISTSPYAHPIVPLLADTAVVAESWAPQPPPVVPSFRYPADAAHQLALGLATMREHGFSPTGCWPPEGSVSRLALSIYAEQGVLWLVTDEGILERSLGQPLRGKNGTAPELYRPWRPDTPSPHLFFRDRWLSDRIGFVYGHWDDEARAAHDLVGHLQNLARELPHDACIVVALDGENPWLHYPEAGGVFLRELMQKLNEPSDDLEPATLNQLAERLQPQALARVHPGSWIGSIFATWIGHPEKTSAWKVLAAVREALGGLQQEELPLSLLLAEGSDWFWWLGDDNPTQLAPLYDRIFRLHLADACHQGGIELPVDLHKPLKTVTVPLQVPLTRRWQPPVLDGRFTSYFEWSLAAWVEVEDPQPLCRLALRAEPQRLYLLVEGEQAISELIRRVPLSIHLLTGSGADHTVSIDAEGCMAPDVECAVGRVAELSLPWDGSSGTRLEVRLGPHTLPAGAVLVLEPLDVDEELNAADNREPAEGESGADS